MGGIILVMASASYGRLFCVSFLGEHLMAKIRKTLFQRLLYQNMTFFETFKTTDLLSRLNQDTSLLQNLLSTTLPTSSRNFVIFVGGVFMLFWTSLKLATLVTLTVPLILMFLWFFRKTLRAASRISQGFVDQTNTLAEESLFSIKTVKTFCREAFTLKHFQGTLENTIHAALSYTKKRAAVTVLVMLLIFGSMGFILWVGGQDVLHQRLTGGELSAFIFYAILVATSLNSLTDLLTELTRCNTATERLEEILSLKEHPPYEGKTLKTAGAIQFSKVSFSYPSRPDQLALHDVSFTLSKGETVAFVGPSGAGKTTLFNLLLKFYTPQQGVLTLGGTDIATCSEESLRQQFSYVPQDPVLFSTTLYENILYANPKASRQDVAQAAKEAGLEAFIQGLPQGYETRVGEKGIRLSGGEKQRVAIARALLRKAPVMLLDEATSALDLGHERIIQQAFAKMRGNTTVLIIAHRLATIMHADRIFVMDRGSIVGEGTHATLLKTNSLYQTLCQDFL